MNRRLVHGVSHSHPRPAGTVCTGDHAVSDSTLVIHLAGMEVADRSKKHPFLCCLHRDDSQHTLHELADKCIKTLKSSIAVCLHFGYICFTLTSAKYISDLCGTETSGRRLLTRTLGRLWVFFLLFFFQQAIKNKALENLW